VIALAPNRTDLENRIKDSVDAVVAVCQERFPNVSISVRFSKHDDYRYRHVFDLQFRLYERNNSRSSSRTYQFAIDIAYTKAFESDLDVRFASLLQELLPDRTPNTESELLQLNEFLSSEQVTLLTARSGRIDLAGTTASNEDIAPRVAAAALAIEDLIEATANSNLHATLRRFAQGYQTELGRLRPGEPGLSWYLKAQAIELYRSNYIAYSAQDPAEYPALEPGIGTLIDSVILATAMLAGILPEIARSQEHIRQYSGDQVDVRTALRELVDPSLSALSHTEGVLTLRAAAVTAEAVALNIGTARDNAPEAVRVHATKAGLLRGFLGAMARLAVAGTHQIANLRENIRTKGMYDVSKEVVKWLMTGGYEKAYRFVADSVSTLLKLATTWPAMFNFVLPLLRLLGLQ
jgi:hypothetical protein